MDEVPLQYTFVGRGEDRVLRITCPPGNSFNKLVLEMYRTHILHTEKDPFLPNYMHKALEQLADADEDRRFFRQELWNAMQETPRISDDLVLQLEIDLGQLRSRKHEENSKYMSQRGQIIEEILGTARPSGTASRVRILKTLECIIKGYDAALASVEESRRSGAMQVAIPATDDFPGLVFDYRTNTATVGNQPL
jgi:hypothetical protein